MTPVRSQRTDAEIKKLIQARTGIKGFEQSIEAAKAELALREEERKAEK